MTPMPLLPPIDLKLLALILGAAAALGGLVVLWRWDRRRRSRAARVPPSGC